MIVSSVIRAVLALWLIMFLKQQLRRVREGAVEEVSVWRRVLKIITPVMVFLWGNRRWIKRLV